MNGFFFRKKRMLGSESFDRKKHFAVRRIKNHHGFYVYVLENVAEGRRIYIPRFVFGRFRACIKRLLTEEIYTDSPDAFERTVTFLNKEYFYLKSSRMDFQNLIIQDLDEPRGSSGYITVARKQLKVLSNMLYSESLQHPSDVLESIISYHKLFQFSFAKTSKSITSDLILRKDVLQTVTDYRPSLAVKEPARPEKLSESEQVKKSEAAHFAKRNTPLKKANYQPRLGERFHEKEIKVDYGQLFSDTKIKFDDSGDDAKNTKDKSETSQLLQFPVALSAKEVKAFGEGKFKIELSTEEASEFRSRFLIDRSGEFYLGFEIVDTLFPVRKVLKTFQFPLYYLKVSIRESGREVRIQAKDDGRIYLNHLALAALVVRFAKKNADQASIGAFFETLLAQHISVDQVNDRIYLTRHLPVADTIFDRTREILFGFQGENGKGGILGDLTFKGIECNLNSVILYRAPSLLSPLEQALERDLDDISRIAHRATHRFYDSLLGRFLTPELASNQHSKQKPMPAVWVPGRLSKSTQQIFHKLHHHDIVLLEGPPGTGKTYTIRNLLIDAVSQGKRVLVVSDQKAAIEALVEKMQDYLLGGESSEAEKKSKISLLFSAFKIIDDIPEYGDELKSVVEQVSRAFKVVEPGEFQQRKVLEKRLSAIDEEIAAQSREISAIMQGHCSDELAFYLREHSKKSRRYNVKALMAFINLAFSEEQSESDLIRSFVANRLLLSKKGLQDCYAYFKLPVDDFSSNISALSKDVDLLSNLKENSPMDLAEFELLTRDSRYHEILRYLRGLVEDAESFQESNVDKFKQVFRSNAPDAFVQAIDILLIAITDQISLLQKFSVWPSEVVEILDDIHETIRVGDKPHVGLTIYQRIQSMSGSGQNLRGASIQSRLEKIDDLLQQRDKLVYERFVGALHHICSEALHTKSKSGTNAITKVMALVENLQQFKTIEESGEVFAELRDCLYDTFPVWLVRKQAVPILLPCREKSFDLVVIDEASQCRVDDAFSLMYRAKKILVVGDDKQTVLHKDSIVDDYLFEDHDLDEHLRSTQARGFKGGGSNIFSLIKSIKQAAVMLDEHYRCPANIIHFSNKYVYDGKLKVMQWRLPE